MSYSIYRQYFTPAECEMLDACASDDLASEINLLRILLTRLLSAARDRRVAGSAKPVHSLPLKVHAAILGAVSASGLVLARLVRLQLALHDPMDEFRREMERGKNVARMHHHVFDYFTPPAPA